MTEKNYLTKEGYEKLKAELKLLKVEKLPAVLSRLKDAIGQGDISENAEYETAIQEKDLIESRVAELEELLNNVQIIEGTGKSSEVKYSSKVRLKDEKGNIYDFTIVGTGEVDILSDTISFESPVGIAIKGKKKGDVVSVRAPNGRRKMTILEIK